jgi:hypothetical protein
MKKIITIFIATTLLVSCKKDEPTNDFKATDVTGTSVVKGVVDKPVIMRQGTGWVNGRTGAAGIPVTVSVNKSSLYPNSSAQGADVYHTTTDATGYYAMTVKSNATGVSARFSIDPYIGSIDTLENGLTRPGQSATFMGTTQNALLYMGHNVTINHSF